MIRILTDSAADIMPDEAKKLGVDVVPLNITLADGTIIKDGLDITPSEYYRHLEACRKLPTTSQPSPEDFTQYFSKAAAAGDEVVAVFISEKLSGTCQCARLAANMAEAQNVSVVDSESVCLGEAMLVRLAVSLRAGSISANEITRRLESAKNHLHLFAVVDDLKYLRKGGRLPAAAAVAGGMLGIKPIISVSDGKVTLAGKARGLPGAYVALFKKINEAGGLSGAVPAMAGYTLSAKQAEPIKSYIQENCGKMTPLCRQIGCVIGTHVGPGAFGIAFFDADADSFSLGQA